MSDKPLDLSEDIYHNLEYCYSCLLKSHHNASLALAKRSADFSSFSKHTNPTKLASDSASLPSKVHCSRYDEAIALLCNCEITLCKYCALEQLLADEQTYRGHITCPLCKFKIPTSAAIRNYEATIKFVEESELNLVNELCSSLNFHRSRRLQYQQAVSYHPIIEALIDDNEKWAVFLPDYESLSVHQLRLLLALIECARDRDHYDFKFLPIGPMEIIQFKQSPWIIQIMSGISKQFSTFCEICDEEIQNNGSVNFNCECLFVCCRSCAIQSIPGKRNTYDEIYCPNCHTLAYIGGVAEAREEEGRLIKSLYRYKVHRSVNHANDDHDSLRKLILKCHDEGLVHLDYIASADAQNKQDDPRMLELKTNYSISQCKLFVARIECRRQHLLASGSVQVSSISPDELLELGPLEKLVIPDNYFMELAIYLRRIMQRKFPDNKDNIKKSASVLEVPEAAMQIDRDDYDGIVDAGGDDDMDDEYEASDGAIDDDAQSSIIEDDVAMVPATTERIDNLIDPTAAEEADLELNGVVDDEDDGMDEEENGSDDNDDNSSYASTSTVNCNEESIIQSQATPLATTNDRASSSDESEDDEKEEDYMDISSSISANLPKISNVPLAPEAMELDVACSRDAIINDESSYDYYLDKKYRVRVLESCIIYDADGNQLLSKITNLKEGYAEGLLLPNLYIDPRLAAAKKQVKIKFSDWFVALCVSLQAKLIA
jgi:hypothetical protein